MSARGPNPRWRRPLPARVLLWTAVAALAALCLPLLGVAPAVILPVCFGVALVSLMLGLDGRMFVRGRVARHGRPGVATIVRVSDTPLTINDKPVVDLVLNVRPDDGSAPFRTVARETVSRVGIPIRGMAVRVSYDPRDIRYIRVTGPAPASGYEPADAYAAAASYVAPAPPETAPPETAPRETTPPDPADPIDEIERLAALHRSGQLTDEEFAHLKARYIYGREAQDG